MSKEKIQMTTDQMKAVKGTELKNYVVAHNWANDESIFFERVDLYVENNEELMGTLYGVFEECYMLVESDEVLDFEIMDIRTGQYLQLID